MASSFKDRVISVDPLFTTFDSLRTIQVNLGDLCNLGCSHCHINASPSGKKMMGRSVMDKIVACFQSHKGLTLDITGGCPEMNPNFRYLIESTRGVAERRILRSNLAIMSDNEMNWLPEFCSCEGLVITASLPCYLEENVSRQRGPGIFKQCISVLRMLNSFGYGSRLELNLVYNPGGDYLPGSQKELEGAYKQHLLENHGITFNNLYTITNVPIGRFLEQLHHKGRYEEYLELLRKNFNPEAACNIMCRSTISIDWQGILYNCDFNQAAAMPLRGDDAAALRVEDLEKAVRYGSEIMLADHCYCCTAGDGSSCTGALAA